jgi:hypothetical protein
MAQVAKLNYVDSKLGTNAGGQQTTRIIYNTVEHNGEKTLEFFKQFQSLTLGQTNLTTNKLDSSESMVVKTIVLQNINFGGRPDAVIDNVIFQRGAILTVTIGNQDVVTKLPVHFNSNGQAYDRLHVFGGNDFTLAPIEPNNPRLSQAPVEIRLVTDIVIPPQVSFSVKLELSNPSASISYATCILAGYGKIFSAGSSF